MKKILAVVLLMTVCLTSSFAAAKYATVGAKYANIRTCAGSKCKIKWMAWKYTPLQMTAVSKDKKWVQVKDFAGHTGWVFSTMLSQDKGLSAMQDTNIRVEPSAGSDIACTVSKGYSLKYISTKGGWLEVEDEPEKEGDAICKGWVSASLVWGPRAKGQAKK